MSIVKVELPVPQAVGYEVRIGVGLLGQLGGIVRGVAAAPSCAVVTDSHVAPLYLQQVREVLRGAGYRVIEFIFEAGEGNKTVGTAMGAMDHLLLSKVERGTPVVALGGGVVGDLAGFVAATMLRGVPFVQVPTTLLSAVDASVGGKVGVDHAAGKNLIGAFWQPRVVVTDIATFGTLPKREVQCGLAECIKHGVIRDKKLFEFMGNNMAKLLGCDCGLMEELVAWNVGIKAGVVMEDPFEKGVRAILNYGHTFGHAIEAVGGYGVVQHGEGVALGMIAAARLAVRMGILKVEEEREIVNLIDLAGLPTMLAGIEAEKVVAAMGTDKKVAGGKVRFILPTGIGSAEVVSEVKGEDVKWATGTLGEPACEWEG